MNRDAAEAEAGAIDQRSVHVVDVLLEGVDNGALGVGLHRDEVDVDLFRQVSARRVLI